MRFNLQWHLHKNANNARPTVLLQQAQNCEQKKQKKRMIKSVDVISDRLVLPHTRIFLWHFQYSLSYSLHVIHWFQSFIRLLYYWHRQCLRAIFGIFINDFIFFFIAALSTLQTHVGSKKNSQQHQQINEFTQKILC